MKITNEMEDLVTKFLESGAKGAKLAFEDEEPQIEVARSRECSIIYRKGDPTELYLIRRDKGKDIGNVVP